MIAKQNTTLFSDLPALRVFALPSSGLKDCVIDHAWALVGLLELDLSGNALTSFGVLGSLPNLSILRLSHNRIKKMSAGRYDVCSSHQLNRNLDLTLLGRDV